MKNRCEHLHIGDVLVGYCGGFFGRDSYGDKRVEGIGSDWVVVREDGLARFYEGDVGYLVKFVEGNDETDSEGSE